MTVPFPLGQIFVPGKIIQIPRESAIKQLALIEVEEHIHHVRVMLDWFYPDASDNLKMAADWHDIGKKIDLRFDYANKLKVLSNHPDERRSILTDDFYGQTIECSVTPNEASKAYVRFLQAKQKEHIKNQGNGYRLNPPFGFHAATVQHTDLPTDLGGDDRNYIINLIHLHHVFRPDRLVEAAAEHGEDILKDLYQLIVADHFASEWATEVVNQLEGVKRKDAFREWRFAEKTLKAAGDAEVVKRDGNVVFGQITLNCESQQLTFNVNYYLQDFHFDGTQTKQGKTNEPRQTYPASRLDAPTPN